MSFYQRYVRFPLIRTSYLRFPAVYICTYIHRQLLHGNHLVSLFTQQTMRLIFLDYLSNIQVVGAYLYKWDS